jgi:hypothetical protein
MNRLRSARCYDQAPIRLASECPERALDLRRITHINWKQLHSKRGRHGLDCGELPNPGRRTDPPPLKWSDLNYVF